MCDFGGIVSEARIQKPEAGSKTRIWNPESGSQNSEAVVEKHEPGVWSEVSGFRF
jgi:hypothetical protein